MSTLLRFRRAPAALLLLTCAALGGAPAASAGEFGLSVDAGYLDLTNARRSARAIFDGSTGGVTGGGSLGFRFDRGFYAEAGARYFERTGERVFTLGHPNPVFRLGHPLKLRLVPVYALIGYRLERRRGFPITPYVAVGGGAYRYHEESEIGGLTEGVLDQTKGAGYGVLGVEYGRGTLRFAVEAAYSTVPKSADLGGVSSVYDEDDIGGLMVVGKLTFVP